MIYSRVSSKYWSESLEYCSSWEVSFWVNIPNWSRISSAFFRPVDCINWLTKIISRRRRIPEKESHLLPFSLQRINKNFVTNLFNWTLEWSVMRSANLIEWKINWPNIPFVYLSANDWVFSLVIEKTNSREYRRIDRFDWHINMRSSRMEKQICSIEGFGWV